MCSAVKDLGYRPKVFLASSIPHLKLKYFVLHLDQVGTKVDSHCNIMVVLKVIFLESLEYTAFSDG
jgi:hypothetical protein